MDKNFQMDTRLRDCEVVHTEIEQMIFNINMKLNVRSQQNYSHFSSASFDWTQKRSSIGLEDNEKGHIYL